MSLPEISRRCLACGASVRAGSRFCPQCGAQMSQERATQEGAGEEASFTPDVLKETFSSWEASAAATRPTDAGLANEAATTNESETARERRGGDSIDPASGTRGNFGDTPGLNEGDARRSLAREPARTTDAPSSSTQTERELESPRTGQTHDAARAKTTATPDASTSGESAAGAFASASAPAKERESLPARRRRRTVAVVEESLRPRVEKLRDASVGMLDDASEDSGLRFIIIALAMLVLFLVFLFISNFLK